MANTTSLFRRAVRCCLLRRGELLTAALAAVLCTASYSFSIWHNSRGATDASILGSAPVIAGGMFCGGAGDSSQLDFEAHHSAENAGLSVSTPAKRRALREAAPAGYRSPFPWPASRGVVWAGNSASGAGLVAAGERWARVDGDTLRFTDARAVGEYADTVGRLVPAPVRTALDVGAMHAGSWAAHVLSRGILAVCAAPWGESEYASVELALERGVPAMLAARVPGRRLPYPARAFDMVHCGGCLVPWHLHGGLFLIEVDRVLRPGGYWVHSGTPGNGTEEHAGIESAVSKMCWKKVADQREIAVWQKPTDHTGCDAGIKFCSAQNHVAAGDSAMAPCITPLPAASAPERRGVTADALSRDGEAWKKRVGYYKAVVNQLGQKGRYRNLLDMNARLGGFAAALAGDPVWVMNVVPAGAAGGSDTDTLGAIYERGLIGAYSDWCEAMPTPPRSYDLLHADSLFSLYRDRCEMEDILLEMDRILRPDSAVIVRDDTHILSKIKSIVDRLQWDSQIVDDEGGPDGGGKLLLAVKTYWTAQDQRQER